MEYKYIPHPEFKPGLYRKERFGVPYIKRELLGWTTLETTLETTVQFKYYDFYIDEVLEPYFQKSKEKILNLYLWDLKLPYKVFKYYYYYNQEHYSFEYELQKFDASVVVYTEDGERHIEFQDLWDSEVYYKLLKHFEGLLNLNYEDDFMIFDKVEVEYDEVEIQI